MQSREKYYCPDLSGQEEIQEFGKGRK